MSRFDLTPESEDQPAFADLKFMAGARWLWNGIKLGITRSGYTDETTGEIVYSYNVTCRVTPGTLVAVNS